MALIETANDIILSDMRFGVCACARVNERGRGEQGAALTVDQETSRAALV